MMRTTANRFKRMDPAGRMMDLSLIDCVLFDLAGSRFQGFWPVVGTGSGWRKFTRTNRIRNLSGLRPDGNPKNSRQDFRPMIRGNPALALRKIHAIMERDRESDRKSGVAALAQVKAVARHIAAIQETNPATYCASGRARAGRDRPMEDNNVDPV